MKKILTIAVVALMTLTMAAQPQRGQQPREGQPGREGQARDKAGFAERMQADKIAFITKYVGLTEEEAKAFWPVYDAAEAEAKQYQAAERETARALFKALNDKLSDKELAELTKAYIAASGKTYDKSKYYEKYAKILPAEKVAKVFLSEERFRRMQINKLGGGHGGHGGPGGPRPERPSDVEK